MMEVIMPLTVRNLTPENLPARTWSGSATHLAHVAEPLGRAGSGEVDYLALCPRTCRWRRAGPTTPCGKAPVPCGSWPSTPGCSPSGIGTALAKAAEAS
jgi:hypothetical protein